MAKMKQLDEIREKIEDAIKENFPFMLLIKLILEMNIIGKYL